MTDGAPLTATDVVMVLCGVVVVSSALLVVTTKQLVHAALWLVVCLGGVAAGFLVMGAQLLAWLQILVYLGGVIVIVLFGFMLTRAPIGPSEDLTSSNRVLAAVVAAAATVGLAFVVVSGFGHSFVATAAITTTSGHALGTALFSYWVLPFEALSVLLLAALVGAIALSRAPTGHSR